MLKFFLGIFRQVFVVFFFGSFCSRSFFLLLKSVIYFGCFYCFYGFQAGYCGKV